MMTSEERREKNFKAKLDVRHGEIYLMVTHNGQQFTSIPFNHKEMAIVKELLSKELEVPEYKVAVGDKVQRNDILPMYTEDVCPENMNSMQVYVVEAIYERTLSNIPFKVEYVTVKLKRLEGEINIDLIDKI